MACTLLDLLNTQTVNKNYQDTTGAGKLQGVWLTLRG
jgi:hypothetical protein